MKVKESYGEAAFCQLPSSYIPRAGGQRTRSSSNEINITFSTLFRVAGSTAAIANANAIGGEGEGRATGLRLTTVQSSILLALGLQRKSV